MKTIKTYRDMLNALQQMSDTELDTKITITTINGFYTSCTFNRFYEDTYLGMSDYLLYPESHLEFFKVERPVKMFDKGAVYFDVR